MTSTMPSLGGVGVWSPDLRWGDEQDAIEAAAELEGLGYSALWLPDVGGDVFGAVERMLAATTTIVVATGILNIWKHAAEETAAEHARLTAIYGNRFLVGLGVSHAPIVDNEEPGLYRRPLQAMVSYLDALDAEPVPLAPDARVLAALGPKMLELAASRTAGVHPYNVTPEHTAVARAAIGTGGLVLPEQAVVLAERDEVRRLATGFLDHYFQMPNYVNNWRRMGFDDDDFAGGGSDRLVDALVVGGSESAIADRIREHVQAGADHVCIQVLSDSEGAPRDVWRALAPALIG